MTNKKDLICIYKLNNRGELSHFNFFTEDDITEKIAKVIFKKDNVLSLSFTIEQVNPSRRKFYRELAEAILNTLLEEKKLNGARKTF